MIWIYLLLAGLAGGLLSTTVGMASLVSYPVLLALGVPPVSADVTNTAALIFSGVGSGLSSIKELRAHPRLTMSVTLWTAVGALLGCFVLVLAPASAFKKVVPFLIFLAGVMMLYSEHRKPRPRNKNVPVTRGHMFLRNLGIFLVGIYIGYFGASAGVLILAILSISLTIPFAHINAIKNFAAFIANVLSIFIYAVTTKVYWLMVIPLGIGMFIGGYIGPIVVRHISTHLLRNVVAFGAFILAIRLFITAYF